MTALCGAHSAGREGNNPDMKMLFQVEKGRRKILRPDLVAKTQGVGPVATAWMTNWYSK